MKDVLTRIAWKNHYTVREIPERSSVPRCEGSDLRVAVDRGSARHLRLLRRVRWFRVGDHRAGRRRVEVHRQAALCESAVVRRRPGRRAIDPDYDYTSFEEVVRSSLDAYQQAGVTDPRSQLAMAEVHDCSRRPNSS